MSSKLLPLAALVLGLLVTRSVAAGTCEEDVVAECVATSCPTFCATVAAGEVDACKASCTAADRCKLTLFGGQDRADQVELDVQKREQLMRCLAENRDPVKVPDDLGKPILAEDDFVEKTDESVKAVKRKSIRDRKVSKKGWKKAKARSFASRKKGSKRRDPVRTDDAVETAKPPATTRPPATKPPATTTPPPPTKPTKPTNPPR